MRALPTDRAEYRRLERRALAVGVGFAVPTIWLTVVMVRALGAEGEARKPGLIAFLGLAVLGVLAWLILRPMWRAAAVARPVTLPADATAGQVYGIPEMDAPLRRNRALSGEEEPPRRW